MSKLTKVAIVGRSNVGKSTLMNKILGIRVAITEKSSGITRDKKEVAANWRGCDFLLLDTGGWSLNPTGLEEQVSVAALSAINESELLIFLVDSRAGITTDDFEMAKVLSKMNKPIFLAVNKVDHVSHEREVWDFLSLGVGDPYPLSALHGKGVADLLDAVIDRIGGTQDNLKEQTTAEDPSEEFAVAIVGRPNVGKSTLFNRIIGSNRSIESELPGTTRDPIDTLSQTEIGLVRFVDTAGIRRKQRINERAEYYALLRALEAIDRSDIALLVIDAKEGVTHQDQRLAERITAAGCPILVLLNKWELCSDEEKDSLSQQVGRRLSFLPNAPLLRLSALTGMGVSHILPALAETFQNYKKRISTREVNDVIVEAQSAQRAPKGGRVLYATQVAIDPPTFVLFVNRRLPSTYLRYLERMLREAFDFGNVPLKFRIKLRK